MKRLWKYWTYKYSNLVIDAFTKYFQVYRFIKRWHSSWVSGSRFALSFQHQSKSKRFIVYSCVWIISFGYHLPNSTNGQIKGHWRQRKISCWFVSLLDDTKPAYCSFFLQFHQWEKKKKITTLFLSRKNSQQLLYCNTQLNWCFQALLEL